MIDGLYSLLARLGFDEPLHSPITHMPIGLVVGALVFFLVAILFKRRSLILSARHASILALVFAFPTILLGVFDWMHFYHGVLMPAIKIKMGLAGGVLVLLGAGIILGSEVKLKTIWMTVIYALSFVAVMGLGWLGAGIIYGRSFGSPTAATSSAQPGQAPGPDGRAVFAANCQSCHGNGGNAIDPAYPLKGSNYLSSLGDFTAFVRKPVTRDGSSGAMPPFPEESLGESEVAALYSYARSAWK